MFFDLLNTIYYVLILKAGKCNILYVVGRILKMAPKEFLQDMILFWRWKGPHEQEFRLHLEANREMETSFPKTQGTEFSQ